jgi:hypothetical protein
MKKSAKKSGRKLSAKGSVASSAGVKMALAIVTRRRRKTSGGGGGVKAGKRYGGNNNIQSADINRYQRNGINGNISKGKWRNINVAASLAHSEKWRGGVAHQCGGGSKAPMAAAASKLFNHQL